MANPRLTFVPGPCRSERAGRVKSCLALAICSGCASSASAQLTSRWLAPVSGSWHTGTNWSTSPFPPQNGAPAGESYNAIIDAVGAAYTVSMNQSTTISGFELSSATATLDHTAGELRVLGDARLNAGIFRLRGGTLVGGTWSGSGSMFVDASSTLRAIRLSVLSQIRSNSTLTVRDGLELNGTIRIGGGVTASDQGILDFQGAQALSGSGVIEFSRPGTGQTLPSQLRVAGGELNIGPGVLVRGYGGTIGGSGTIRSNGLISSDVSDQTITINAAGFNNSGVLQAINGGNLSLTSATWNNSGLVTATDGDLTFGGTWTSSGTIEATRGTITTGGNWNNTGEIVVGSGSTLNLAGNFSTSSRGILNRLGGTVNLTGNLNNTASEVVFDSSTGSWLLQGGSVTGGILRFRDGESLQFSSSTQNRFTSVFVDGDIALSSPSASLRIAGTTLSGDIRLSGDGATLTLASPHEFGGLISLDGSSGATRRIALEPAAVLTVGPSAVLRGGRGEIAPVTPGTANGVVNLGLISADVAGQTLSIRSASFQNFGNAQAIGGTTLSIDSAAWSNTGRMIAVGSTLALAGTSWSNSGAIEIQAGARLTTAGAWSNSSRIAAEDSTVDLGGTVQNSGSFIENVGGSTINILGNVNNSGAVLRFGGVGGSWNMAGGSIQGGTIELRDGQRLLIGAQSTNQLRDLTVIGDVWLDAPGASVRFTRANVTGDVVLQGTGSTLTFDAPQMFDGSIRSLGQDGSNRRLLVGNNSTIQFGQNALLRGGRLEIGNASGSPASVLRNEGVISSDVAGETILANVANFMNHGVIQAVNGGNLSISSPQFTNVGALVCASGSLTMGGTWSNPGLIECASGTLNLGGTWSSFGTIRAINSDVSLGGSFATSSLASFERQGGTLRLSGVLNNANATLSVDATKGLLTIDQGTISGGVLRFTDPRLFAASSSSSNRLTNVVVDGPMDLAGSGALLRLTSVNLIGPVTLSGPQATLTVENPMNFGGDLVFDAAAGGSARRISVEGSASLKFDTGALVRGGNAEIRSGIFQGGASSLTNNGIISADRAGQSISVSTATLTNTGAMQAINNGSLSISSAWTNSGVLRAVGGSVSSSGGGVNYGTVEIASGTGAFTGALLNVGAVHLSNAATASFSNLQNYRTTGSRLVGGTWTIGPGSSITTTGITITRNAASVTFEGAGSTWASLEALTVNEGALSVRAGRNLALGSGGFVSNSGTISIDTSSSILVGSDFVNEFGGSLRIEVSRDQDLLRSGRVAVTDDADLSGRLVITAAQGYVPAWGDVFDVLTFGSSTGDFSSRLFPALQDPGLRWFWRLESNRYQVGVTALADLDASGRVTEADLQFVQRELGSVGTDLWADVTLDGVVDDGDLDLIRGMIGIAAGDPVPPPSVASALAIAGAACSGLRRRRGLTAKRT